MTWDQVLAWRMKRQHLLERATADDLLAVVDRLCGLHAQVMSSVELALCARVDGLTREAVQDALWQARTLVKLWGMRGTLHVFTAADLGLWLAGLRTYDNSWPHLRTPDTVELADLVGKALRGKVLTREELAAAVEQLSGSTELGEVVHGSWGGSLKPASFLGRLCFGPSKGQLVQFTHPETWLRTAPAAADNNEALASIAKRYLGTYGPATASELGAWWGVNRTGATLMLAALGDAAVEVDVDGKPYWMLAEHVDELASAQPANVVRLLPGFDQWVVCANRRDGLGSRAGPGKPALDPEYRTRIYRLQGWVSAVLLVDGRIVGVWKHQRRGGRLHIEIEPFEKLPRSARQPIEAEAERVAQFLGGQLALTVA